MILELDLGNTRCKWRLVDGGAVVERGNELLRDLPTVLPVASRVRVASVLSAAKEDWLATELEARLGVQPEFARSGQFCAGVSNAYQEPTQLGVDRWLGMLASYQALNSALLVVSVGTAVTLDELDDGGVHVGGYILPGPQLMLDALRHGTDKVRFSDGPWQLRAGQETGECVIAGALLAIIGAVLAARRVGGAVVVTGGYGARVAEELSVRGIAVTLVPELVMDGLRLALP